MEKNTIIGFLILDGSMLKKDCTYKYDMDNSTVNVNCDVFLSWISQHATMELSQLISMK
jgi:hypothetical protein